MRTRLLTVLLGFAAIPVLADDVYLKNGRSFEGVIAETTDDQVHIRMSGGVISLPRSQVLRVEKGESTLAEYLRRKEALRRGAETRAADWLELARWARTQELEPAAREAALTAAQLDPRMKDLGTILRGFGYVYDEQLDRWIPYADSMRRRGFVLSSNGQWITREEQETARRRYEDELAQHRAARQEEARAAREDRLAALTALALTQESRRPTAEPYSYPVVIIPGYYFPPVITPPGPDPGHPRPPHHPPFEPDSSSPSSFTRVPGSLIPGGFPSSSSSPRKP